MINIKRFTLIIGIVALIGLNVKFYIDQLKNKKQLSFADTYNKSEFQIRAAIPQNLVNSMEQSFNWFYKSKNVNDKVINIKGLKINLRQFLSKFSISNRSELKNKWLNVYTQGVVFRYILPPMPSPSQDTVNYFSYAFYAGNAGDDINNKPIVNWINHMGNINSYINGGASTDCISHCSDYDTKLKINSFENGSYFISEIKKDSVNSHPNRCYYSFGTLYYFLTHNENIVFNADDSIKSNVYIEIVNGAIFLPNTSPLVNNFMFQTPIIILNNGTRVLSNSYDPYLYYKDKALDIGKLCPTDCDIIFYY